METTPHVRHWAIFLPEAGRPIQVLADRYEALADRVREQIDKLKEIRRELEETDRQLCDFAAAHWTPEEIQQAKEEYSTPDAELISRMQNNILKRFPKSPYHDR